MQNWMEKRKTNGGGGGDDDKCQRMRTTERSCHFDSTRQEQVCENKTRSLRKCEGQDYWEEEDESGNWERTDAPPMMMGGMNGLGFGGRDPISDLFGQFLGGGGLLGPRGGMFGSDDPFRGGSRGPFGRPFGGPFGGDQAGNHRGDGMLGGVMLPPGAQGMTPGSKPKGPTTSPPVDSGRVFDHMRLQSQRSEELRGGSARVDASSRFKRALGARDTLRRAKSSGRVEEI